MRNRDDGEPAPEAPATSVSAAAPTERASSGAERERPRGRRRLRLPAAVGIVLLVLTATTGLVGLVGFAPPGDEVTPLSLFALVTELWIAAIAVLGALALSPATADTLGLRAGRLRAWEIVVLAVGTLGASHALDGALQLSGWMSEDSVLVQLPRMLHGVSGASAVLVLVALGLAPGFAEELLCRGLIQRGVARRLGPRVAIPLAALLFGALHVEPVHAAFATVLGLYLGLVAWWADSTRAAMVCHAANNLAAVGVAMVASDLHVTPLSALVAGGLAVACLGAVARSRERPRG